MDVARGARLEEVRAGLVERANEEADAVRAAHVHLRAALVLVRDVGQQARRLERRAVDVLVVEALRAHVLGERARVGVEPRDRDADVVVDLEQLLLVSRQVVRRTLERGEHNVLRADDAKARRALLHGLHRVLDLEQPPLRAPDGHVGVVHRAEHLSRRARERAPRSDGRGTARHGRRRRVQRREPRTHAGARKNAIMSTSKQQMAVMRSEGKARALGLLLPPR